MLIWKGAKLLLIERKLFPFGFAPPAGHVDDKGSFENAAREETREEVGLEPIKLKLLTSGKKNNRCRRKGGDHHQWKIYEVETRGKIKPSKEETKQAGWYTKKQIGELTVITERYIKGEISDKEWEASPGIETVWYEWFKELGII